MNKLFKQGVFIVGARKCGTTQLFDLLQNHSEINRSRVKEPAFFCLSDEIIRQNLDYYKGLFENNQDQMILDGSTYYMTFPKSIQQIRNYVEQGYFIIILRNPVDRFFSAYHYVNRFERNDKRNLTELVRDYQELDTSTDIDQAESDLVMQAANRGVINPSLYNKDSHRTMRKGPMDTDFEDFLWEYKYLRLSKYSDLIRDMEKYGMSNYHVVFLEELIRDKSKVLNSISDFLNLSEGFSDVRLRNKNRGFQIKYPALNSILSLAPNVKLGLGLRNAIHQKFSARIEVSYQQKKIVYDKLKGEFDFWFDKEPVTKDLWKTYE